MAKNQQLKFFSQEPSFFRINQDIKNLSKDKHYFWAMRYVAGLLLVLTVIIALFWPQIPIQIPFFYSQSWGVDQLATKKWLWWFIGVMVIISLINLTVVSRLRTKNPVIAQIYMWATMVMVTMAFIGIIKILSVLSVW